jgi:hypothetical protein
MLIRRNQASLAIIQRLADVSWCLQMVRPPWTSVRGVPATSGRRVVHVEWGESSTTNAVMCMPCLCPILQCHSFHSAAHGNAGTPWTSGGFG